MITATVGLGFEFELVEKGVGGLGKGGLRTREGFLRKPVGCGVRVRRRVRGEGRERG